MIVATLLLAVGVTGLVLVERTTSLLDEGLPAPGAEAPILRYAPPAGCRGARVIQTLQPVGFLGGLPDVLNLVSYVSDDGGGWYEKQFATMFEVAHNADFDGDGDSTSEITEIQGQPTVNASGAVGGTMRIAYPFSDRAGSIEGVWDDNFISGSQTDPPQDGLVKALDRWGEDTTSNTGTGWQGYNIRAAESEIRIATHQGRGCWTAFWCHPNDQRGFRDPSCGPAEERVASYALPTWCRGAASNVVRTIPAGTGSEDTVSDVTVHRASVDGLSELEHGADFDGDGLAESAIDYFLGAHLPEAGRHRTNDLTDPGDMWVVYPHDSPESWDDSPDYSSTTYMGNTYTYAGQPHYVQRAIESEVRIAVDPEAGCWTVFWCHPDQNLGFRDPSC